MLYDASGNKITDIFDTFIDNANIDYEYDSSGSVNYSVIRIYRTKIDGTKQYPFVYAPYGTGTSTLTTLTMQEAKGWAVAINAGIFDTSDTTPVGVVIQNGVLIQDGPAGTLTERRTLTIDGNGNLASVADDSNGATLVSNGIVSAVCGFGPIIVDYEAVDVSYIPNRNENAQRQIFGQFGNGDYCILTCEGRNYDHSDGWTMVEAQAVCQKLGLKFAFNLDGGGSTETVIGLRQINSIYEGAKGRKVPTFIVFNGTNTFAVPNN